MAVGPSWLAPSPARGNRVAASRRVGPGVGLRGDRGFLEGTAMPKLTHAEATKRLKDAGVTWSSSGNCSERTNKKCTSFEQVNSETIDGIISFKRVSGCDVNITGGTETGHSTSTRSHWNGYK